MDSELRKRCARRLRQLGVPLPIPFSAEAFCANLAAARGRPIHLLAQDTSTATVACGLWVSTTAADYIFFERTAPPMLADHIVLHEVSHLLCGHRGALALDQPAGLFELLDPDLVRSVLGRTSAYDEAEEREAELLASMIGERANGYAAGAAQPADSSVAAVMNRFGAAFTADRIWHE